MRLSRAVLEGTAGKARMSTIGMTMKSTGMSAMVSMMKRLRR